MTFEQNFVTAKLSMIADYLEDAERIFARGYEYVLKNVEKRLATERLCQLLVDAMLAINHHFIKELNLKVSDDLQGTFYILGENNILPMDFAKKIAPVVSIRNRLVHKYEEIDKELFVRSFFKDRDDFKKYVQFINDYMLAHPF